MVSKGCFYLGASLCKLCESSIFGARAVFGMDASLVFLQGVLAVVPLIGGVFDVVFRACSGMLGRASSLVCGCHSPVSTFLSSWFITAVKMCET